MLLRARVYLTCCVTKSNNKKQIFSSVRAQAQATSHCEMQTLLLEYDVIRSTQQSTVYMLLIGRMTETNKCTFQCPIARIKDKDGYLQ